MAATTRVWDLPIRLFHWGLVALLGFSWWSERADLMDWHRRAGYAVLGLLVFRLYWGFAGSQTARFATFVKGPGAVMAYARTLVSRGRAYAPARPGHNPMGGWSVVALLLALVAMVGAGLFAVDVDGLESGPLADRVSFDVARKAAHIHGFVFNVLLALVGLHIAAIAFYRLWLKEDLVSPMVTGRARNREPGEGAGPVAIWRALIGVVVSAAVAWAASRGFFFAAAS